MSSSSQQVKDKQEDKLQFEVTYIGNTILSTMSYLDLADDPRTKELYTMLDRVHSEVERIKASKFAKSEHE